MPRIRGELTRSASRQPPKIIFSVFNLNKMLSIQTSSKSAKCNILPCRINHTGSTNATEKHWIALDGEDGSTPESLSIISMC